MRITSVILLIASASMNATAAEPKDTYPITIDLNDQVHRQVVVDREAGQYLGGPRSRSNRLQTQHGRRTDLERSAANACELGNVERGADAAPRHRTGRDKTDHHVVRIVSRTACRNRRRWSELERE